MDPERIKPWVRDGAKDELEWDGAGGGLEELNGGDVMGSGPIGTTRGRGSKREREANKVDERWNGGVGV